MHLIDHYQKMFDYDSWANRQLMSSLESSGNPPQRSLRLFAHILSAQILWYQRLKSEAQTYPVWPEFTLLQCKEQVGILPELWKNYLRQSDLNLTEVITYTNSKGEKWANQREDILQHVLTHSVHHRGQMVADLRLSGYEPPYLDFIHAVRQNLMR